MLLRGGADGGACIGNDVCASITNVSRRTAGTVWSDSSSDTSLPLPDDEPHPWPGGGSILAMMAPAGQMPSPAMHAMSVPGISSTQQ